MVLRLVAAVLVWALCMPSALAQKWDWPPVPLYVTSAGASEGRTDPSKDNRDSVTDIAESLRKNSKVVRIVERPEDATITLIVQGRERGEVGPLGRDYTLAALLRVDSSEAPIRASVNGGTIVTNNAWKRAAERVAEQVHTWVAENRATLK